MRNREHASNLEQRAGSVGMSAPNSGIKTPTLGLHSLDEYKPLIGTAATERILSKAEQVRALHTVHVSSTFYGGGVTELLTPLTLMMNAIGLETGWRMIQGTPASTRRRASRHDCPERCKP